MTSSALGSGSMPIGLHRVGPLQWARIMEAANGSANAAAYLNWYYYVHGTRGGSRKSPAEHCPKCPGVTAKKAGKSVKINVVPGAGDHH